MTIVVTGGSGFIGTALTKVLLAKGHTVIVIDKHGPALTHTNLFFIPCDLEEQNLPFNVLERTDAVIHLAGKHTLAAIEENESESAASVKHLIASLSQTTNRPQIFITASSVGYYGTSTQELDEREIAGTTKAAKLIEMKEEEAMIAEQFRCRVVIIRTAPVIGIGGFMSPILRAAKAHIVFRYTRQDFWMPWIHLNDLIHIYLFALETNTVQGPINAVAPMATKYSDFIEALKKVTRSINLPMAPLTKWPYPAKIREQFVDQKIVPQRLLDKGFEFAYTNIIEAITDVAHKKHHETN